MGERGNTEERIQAEKSQFEYFSPFFSLTLSFLSVSLILRLFLPAESKNSSVADSHLARSEDSDAAQSYPPFSSLMLMHIKGQKRFGSSVSA